MKKLIGLLFASLSLSLLSGCTVETPKFDYTHGKQYERHEFNGDFSDLNEWFNIPGNSKTLAINWVNGPISFVAGENLDLKVVNMNQESKEVPTYYAYNMEEEFFSIDFAKKGQTMKSLEKVEKKLLITLPRNGVEHSLGDIAWMYIYNVSGEVKMDFGENDNLQWLSVDTVSGDIDIRGACLDRLKVNTVSGNVFTWFKKIYIQEINVNSVSGNVELTLNAHREVDVDFNTVSGTLYHTPESFSNAEDLPNSFTNKVILTCNTVSGNFTVSPDYYAHYLWDN